jgi:hypothetical protein
MPPTAKLTPILEPWGLKKKDMQDQVQTTPPAVLLIAEEAREKDGRCETEARTRLAEENCIDAGMTRFKPVSLVNKFHDAMSLRARRS